MLARARFASRVHEQEATRAIGVLRISRIPAALPEERRLLVARNPTDGNALHHAWIRRDAILRCRRAHIGHHGCRDAEQVKEPRIPAAVVYVVEHRAAGVRHIGGMHGTIGELPDEPAIHRAECEPPLLCHLARASDLIQDPPDLAGREIRIGHEARLILDGLSHHGVLAELLYHGCRPATLPDDRVVDGLAGLLVPNQRGLTLVRDADGVYLRGVHVVGEQQFRQRAQLRGEDISWIMLYPSGVRVDLREGALHAPRDPPRPLHQHGARGCGPLIERDDVSLVRHGHSSPGRPLHPRIAGRPLSSRQNEGATPAKACCSQHERNDIRRSCYIIASDGLTRALGSAST